MTNLSGTINHKRMGRPPLNVKETKVRLSDETRARIERLLPGNYQMAKFIREAIDEKLDREEAKAKE